MANPVVDRNVNSMLAFCVGRKDVGLSDVEKQVLSECATYCLDAPSRIPTGSQHRSHYGWQEGTIDREVA